MALATSTGDASGDPINDSYGSLTQIADTVITRVVYPHSSARTIIGGFIYTAGTTAHNVVCLTCHDDDLKVVTEAASGQATIKLNRVPTNLDGSALASGDYFIVQYDDLSWVPVLYSSISGTTITMTANFAQDIQIGTTVYYMGSVADHTDRTFTVPASTTRQIEGSDFRVRVATSPKINQPILVHSSNATAAGTLHWLSFYYE